jgi:hypothetical protein
MGEGDEAGTGMTELERLVREWRDAQRAIDRMTQIERRRNAAPLHRLLAAHAALVKYADEELANPIE